MCGHSELTNMCDSQAFSKHLKQLQLLESSEGAPVAMGGLHGSHDGLSY